MKQEDLWEKESMGYPYNGLVFGTAINILTLTKFDQARPATDSENAKITEKWYVE